MCEIHLQLSLRSMFSIIGGLPFHFFLQWWWYWESFKPKCQFPNQKHIWAYFHVLLIKERHSGYHCYEMAGHSEWSVVFIYIFQACGSPRSYCCANQVNKPKHQPKICHAAAFIRTGVSAARTCGNLTKPAKWRWCFLPGKHNTTTNGS